MTEKLRILVVTRSYPATHDLYQYPFVHRRVLAYRELGHDVAVFRPSLESAGAHLFDGVECLTGDGAALDRLAARFRPDVLAVHGLGPATWPVIEPTARSLPLAGWLHGSEIPGFLRRKARIDGRPVGEAQATFDRCANFWRNFMDGRPAGTRLVFPSKTAVLYAHEGVHLDRAAYAVIPNPIDTRLFAYHPKAPERRFDVLLLRPFDSRCYANDVAVSAILRLRDSREFEKFRFRILGDGPLFEEIVGPVRELSNVTVSRGFLTQDAIAREHRASGIFLVPTRLDTQGVSRDEAMSSGLVPVTNAIGPIGEFVDDSCAALAPSDDPDAVASALAGLAADAVCFAEKSTTAARRIRATRSNERIIPLDIELLRRLANG